MPLYEFQCGKCGSRFETLTSVGIETHECTACGASGAPRVMSQPAQPPKLVKSAAGNRRQEAKNRKLKAATKADFKAKRASARAAAKQRGGGR